MDFPVYALIAFQPTIASPSLKAAVAHYAKDQLLNAPASPQRKNPMPKKVGKFLYLIKTRTEVIMTDKCPKDLVINLKKNTWALRGLPPGPIGEFDQRFYYNESSEDPIGVFRSNNIKHLMNLATCFDWHLRKILGQPRDISGNIPETPDKLTIDFENYYFRRERQQSRKRLKSEVSKTPPVYLGPKTAP